MKITFMLPGIGLHGGIKVVFQYANLLKQRGHQVTIVHPLIPMKFGAKWYNLRNLIGRGRGFRGNLKGGNRVEWFQLETSLRRALCFSEKYRLPLVDEATPDADIIVATAWATAYTVNNLSERKGKKFYLIQHYELYELWDEAQLWDEAKKIESNPLRLPLAVIDINTSSFCFHKLREKVDGSYKLPLRKITISSWLKALLEEKFNQEIEALIVNGINTREFFNEGKEYNNVKKRILMLYHKIRWKGVEDGKKAFEIARQEHPEIQLVMFGTRRGPDVPAYAEFHQNIYGEDLRKLYCSCDIFICPSWVEGCQLPPMEAMACKCAVVATNVGGIPDYAIHGETALVAPPRCPELLAENIIRLVENKELLMQVSEAGYNHIRNFTWDKATDALEQTFKRVLKEMEIGQGGNR